MTLFRLRALVRCVGNDRLPRWGVKGRGCRRGGDDQINEADGDYSGAGHKTKEDSEGHHRALGEEQDPPPVMGIGVNPSHQREEYERDHPDQTDQTQGHGGTGQQVNMPADCYHLHLCAGFGNHLPGPHPPEIRMMQCSKGGKALV
jgi:hypothetical protein